RGRAGRRRLSPGRRRRPARPATVQVGVAPMADEEGAPRQRGHAVRVAVVEDESLMRWMIRKIVEARPDMVLVHEAAGLAEGRDLVQPGTTDVVVMDIDLGDGASRSPGSCSGATRAWA